MKLLGLSGRDPFLAKRSMRSMFIFACFVILYGVSIKLILSSRSHRVPLLLSE